MQAGGTIPGAAPTVGETLHQDPAALAEGARLSTSRPPPAQIPGYVIQRCIGDGAYGSVWLAAEENTGKRVAIKFYNRPLGQDWSLLNREVEKLAVLYTCREIVGLLQVGWDADPPFYVMEYLENGSLAQLLEKGPLPLREAERIITPVAQALVHAHHQGILHCDVKPANVLLDAALAPRLADFGQSRLSHERSPSLGTLFYMAPEQADLQAVPDARWDVYALGALLYHMLTGRAPYRTTANEARLQSAMNLEEPLTLYREIVSAGPRPADHRGVPGVTSQLAEIVDRCLEPEPAKRFLDARSVLRALDEHSRSRTRRPFILLGIFGPILLMLAMMPLAWFAMSQAVGTAERNLAGRALESDVVTAKILAQAVEEAIEQRSLELVEIASDSDLRRGLESTGESRETLRKLMENFKAETDRELATRRWTLDDSWFLTDAAGRQVWRGPHSAETVGHNFAWRDYFHGQGRDYAEGQAPAGLKPIRGPHVSQAFLSQATDRYRVAISVPVWNDAHTQVVGVLGRSLGLGQLLNEYQRLIEAHNRTDVHRILALVDLQSGRILDHPWMIQKGSDGLPLKELDRLVIGPEQRQALQELSNVVSRGNPVEGRDRDARYFDAVAELDDNARKAYGMPWLAAFWPVGDTHWVAIVQERRDEALKPVREIQDGLVHYALGGLGLCCLVVALLWLFVLRAIGWLGPPLAA
jgi:hypothetical protein